MGEISVVKWSRKKKTTKKFDILWNMVGYNEGKCGFVKQMGIDINVLLMSNLNILVFCVVLIHTYEHYTRKLQSFVERAQKNYSPAKPIIRYPTSHFGWCNSFFKFVTNFNNF